MTRLEKTGYGRLHPLSVCRPHAGAQVLRRVLHRQILSRRWQYQHLRLFMFINISERRMHPPDQTKLGHSSGRQCSRQTLHA